MPSHANTFSQEATIELCLQLLEALSSSRSRRVSICDLLDQLGVDEQELDELIGVVSFLTDSASGARAAIYREGDEVILGGDAAKIETLRLTATTSSLLNLLLEQGAFDERTGTLTMDALAGPDVRDVHDELAGTTGPLGRFSSLVYEAIEDGVRCRLVYRTAGETASRARTIDPLEVSSQQGRFYLIAWDVEQDAQRRYRLDLVEDLTLTDDSVLPHCYQRETVEESLEKQGAEATVRWYRAGSAQPITWRNATALPGDETSEVDGLQATFIDYRVCYGSEEWLFERVLEAGGNLVILSPSDLRERFVAYARALLP